MPKYNVILPINGCVNLEIEADSEEQAIQKGLQEDINTDDIDEFNTYKNLLSGNVFEGDYSEAQAEEIVEDESSE